MKAVEQDRDEVVWPVCEEQRFRVRLRDGQVSDDNASREVVAVQELHPDTTDIVVWCPAPLVCRTGYVLNNHAIHRHVDGHCGIDHPRRGQREATAFVSEQVNIGKYNSP
jgi:hypothetical protein